MARVYDVIVAGMGAMGSAALRALARRGKRALGLDRFTPPHDRGSSHGQSRIIREAYFEHPAYVPLVQRAYLLWEELERESGEKLLIPTGGLMVGPRDGILVGGALRSALEHGLVYESLNAAEIHRRFPAFHPDPLMVGVWEPRAGVLFPEKCIAAFLSAARRHGAEIQNGEPVLSWRARGDRVEVETAQGRYEAGSLVISAGAWTDRLLPDLHPPLSVERVPLYWFEPLAAAERFHPSRCPISIWEYEPERFFYSFPLLGPGVKVALHHQGEAANPDRLRRDTAAAESAALRPLLRRYLPDANGALADAAVCMYTNTPDGDFIIDRHPEHPQVLIVSACSGHGFKFAPAIGEIASDLLVEGWTRFDLSRFCWSRAGIAGRRPDEAHGRAD